MSLMMYNLKALHVHSWQKEPVQSFISTVAPYPAEAGPGQPETASSAAPGILYSVGLRILTFLHFLFLIGFVVT